MSEPVFRLDEQVTWIARGIEGQPHLRHGPHVLIAAIIQDDGREPTYMVRHEGMRSMGQLFGPWPADRLRRGWVPVEPAT